MARRCPEVRSPARDSAEDWRCFQFPGTRREFRTGAFGAPLGKCQAGGNGTRTGNFGIRLHSLSRRLGQHPVASIRSLRKPAGRTRRKVTACKSRSQRAFVKPATPMVCGRPLRGRFRVAAGGVIDVGRRLPRVIYSAAFRKIAHGAVFNRKFMPPPNEWFD